MLTSARNYAAEVRTASGINIRARHLAARFPLGLWFPGNGMAGAILNSVIVGALIEYWQRAASILGVPV